MPKKIERNHYHNNFSLTTQKRTQKGGAKFVYDVCDGQNQKPSL